MTTSDAPLMRVIYFSRNGVSRTGDVAAEIDRILSRSRENNARDAVTGALIFNDGVFGQVLEGPRQAVEDTFERIQMDDRHHDVTVLDIATIAERSFGSWSMDFVGRGTAAIGNGETPPGFDISLLDGDEVFEMLHALMLRDEGAMRAA